MIGRSVIAALAVMGIAGTVAGVIVDSRERPAEKPPITPPTSPYTSYVAGAALIEAGTGNITIGSPVTGVASDLYIHVGDFVKSGEPLFQIDDRALEAQLTTATARVALAEAKLQRPAHRLNYSEQLAQRDATAVSADALSDLRDQVAVAESDLALAKAQVKQLKLEIERYTVRAPKAGRVLQLNLRAGEYVDGSGAPLVLFGDDRTLFVRVDIDESDAWRIEPGAAAMGFVRGNPTMQIPLNFEYVEPHIIPKTSLTGRGTERSDTRVLQVLYSFERGSLPVYVGQQLDVYIQAKAFATDEEVPGN